MRFFLFIGLLALCVVCTMSNKTMSPLAQVDFSCDKFSTDFYSNFHEDYRYKNLIVSPLSAFFILAMATYGAESNTSTQMRNALHLPSNDTIAHQGFGELLNNLRSYDKVTFETANKIYIANNLKVKDEYKQLTTGVFHSEAGEVDVQNTKDAIDSINNWVNEKTHQKIKNIMKDGDINVDTRMILLNAMYFKGKWATPFVKENTEDKTFHLDEKNEIKVPMMHRKGSMVYVEDSDFKMRFIILPYENDNIQMAIILPDDFQGLNNISEKLKSFNRRRFFLMTFPTREVDLYLPKFKIESTLDLEKNIKQMGMTDMFTDAANFSGISNEKLKVGKILQKAFIEINEEGSEAAATSKLTIMTKSSVRFPKSDPITFIVDRPFHVLIGTPDVTLFEGHVYNPAI